MKFGSVNNVWRLSDWKLTMWRLILCFCFFNMINYSVLVSTSIYVRWHVLISHGFFHPFSFQLFKSLFFFPRPINYIKTPKKQTGKKKESEKSIGFSFFFLLLEYEIKDIFCELFRSFPAVWSALWRVIWDSFALTSTESIPVDFSSYQQRQQQWQDIYRVPLNGVAMPISPLFRLRTSRKHQMMKFSFRFRECENVFSTFLTWLLGRCIRNY